jgi:hypothetical protein
MLIPVLELLDSTLSHAFIPGAGLYTHPSFGMHIPAGARALFRQVTVMCWLWHSFCEYWQVWCAMRHVGYE